MSGTAPAARDDLLGKRSTLIEDADTRAGPSASTAIAGKRTSAREASRLHGAWDGGWSAGYYNTVGSKEGWEPARWKSGDVRQAEAAEAFMDEEDIRDMMRNKMRVRGGYEGGVARGGGGDSGGGGGAAASGGGPSFFSSLLLRPSSGMGAQMLRRAGYHDVIRAAKRASERRASLKKKKEEERRLRRRRRREQRKRRGSGRRAGSDESSSASSSSSEFDPVEQESQHPQESEALVVVESGRGLGYVPKPASAAVSAPGGGGGGG
eukprot:Rhum_TRINITY_DN14733_c9_g1::Rhum_TRINITY_DN14733_c9_g1_i1::g.113059::m.113059